MKNVKSLFEIFKSSISFLTILPVKSDVSTMEDFKKIVLFFPLTAFFLGTYYYMCSYIIYLISGSIFFTAVLYTAMTVILTGGLHYDGLSDSFDGLFCGKDREKMLIFSVIFSRSMQVVFSYSSNYAKEDGMGNIFIGKIRKKEMIFVLCSYFVLSLPGIVLFSPSDLILRDFAITTVLSSFVLFKIKKSIELKIGGITCYILWLVAEVG